jgi:hypothetical protein
VELEHDEDFNELQVTKLSWKAGDGTTITGLVCASKRKTGTVPRDSSWLLNCCCLQMPTLMRLCWCMHMGVLPSALSSDDPLLQTTHATPIGRGATPFSHTCHSALCQIPLEGWLPCVPAVV